MNEGQRIFDELIRPCLHVQQEISEGPKIVGAIDDAVAEARQKQPIFEAMNPDYMCPESDCSKEWFPAVDGEAPVCPKCNNVMSMIAASPRLLSTSEVRKVGNND